MKPSGPQNRFKLENLEPRILLSADAPLASPVDPADEWEFGLDTDMTPVDEVSLGDAELLQDNPFQNQTTYDPSHSIDDIFAGLDEENLIADNDDSGDAKLFVEEDDLASEFEDEFEGEDEHDHANGFEDEDEYDYSSYEESVITTHQQDHIILGLNELSQPRSVLEKLDAFGAMTTPTTDRSVGKFFRFVEIFDTRLAKSVHDHFNDALDPPDTRGALQKIEQIPGNYGGLDIAIDSLDGGVNPDSGVLRNVLKIDATRKGKVYTQFPDDDVFDNSVKKQRVATTTADLNLDYSFDVDLKNSDEFSVVVHQFDAGFSSDSRADDAEIAAQDARAPPEDSNNILDHTGITPSVELRADYPHHSSGTGKATVLHGHELDPRKLNTPSAALTPLDLRLVNNDVKTQQGQLFYLDFDGAADVTYNGPITIEEIDVPAFAAPGDLAGREASIMSEVTTALNKKFTDLDVTFTTDQPEPGTAYSTIFVGGDDTPFAAYGSFLGVAEQVDVGNRNPEDNAFVFSDGIAERSVAEAEFVHLVAEVTAHETRHLLGFAHEVDVPANGPLADVAAGTVDLQGQPAWVPQGPSNTTGGQVLGMKLQGNPVSGAIQVVALHPNFGELNMPGNDTAFVGTVNGGLWKTTNFSATRAVHVEESKRGTIGAPDVSNVAITPSNAPQNGNPTPAGIYRYRIVVEDSNGNRSKPSMVIGPISLSGIANHIELNGVPNDGTKRIVYRTQGDQDDVYFKVQEITGNTNTYMSSNDNLDTTDRLVAVPFPDWTPLTDDADSLAIGTIAFDPDDPNMLYAGTGSSSSSHKGGPSVGILKSTDGGTNFELIGRETFDGLKIRKIIPYKFLHDNVEKTYLLVATEAVKPGHVGGLFILRHDDDGWERLSDGESDRLPRGTVTDLIEVKDMAATSGKSLLAGVVRPESADSDVYLDVNAVRVDVEDNTPFLAVKVSVNTPTEWAALGSSRSIAFTVDGIRREIKPTFAPIPGETGSGPVTSMQQVAERFTRAFNDAFGPQQVQARWKAATKELFFVNVSDRFKKIELLGDPDSGQTLLGPLRAGIWRSQDNGNTWQQVTDLTLPTLESFRRTERIQFAAHGAKTITPTIYAATIVVDGLSRQLNGLFRSDDIGTTWRQVIDTPRSRELDLDLAGTVWTVPVAGAEPAKYDNASEWAKLGKDKKFQIDLDGKELIPMPDFKGVRTMPAVALAIQDAISVAGFGPNAVSVEWDSANKRFVFKSNAQRQIESLDEGFLTSSLFSPVQGVGVYLGMAERIANTDLDTFRALQTQTSIDINIDDPAVWSGQADTKSFSVTVDGIRRDLTPDFTGVSSMEEVARRFERTINAAYAPYDLSKPALDLQNVTYAASGQEGTHLTPNGVYRYAVVAMDAQSVRNTPAVTVGSITLPANRNTITLKGLSANADTAQLLIYRTVDGGEAFHLVVAVDTTTTKTGLSFTDALPDAEIESQPIINPVSVTYVPLTRSFNFRSNAATPISGVRDLNAPQAALPSLLDGGLISLVETIKVQSDNLALWEEGEADTKSFSITVDGDRKKVTPDFTGVSTMEEVAREFEHTINAAYAPFDRFKPALDLSNVTDTLSSQAGSHLTPKGIYRYQIVAEDAQGVRNTPAVSVPSITLPANRNTITLKGLSANTDTAQLLIYRTVDGGEAFHLVGAIDTTTTKTGLSFTDALPDAVIGSQPLINPVSVTYVPLTRSFTFRSNAATSISGVRDHGAPTPDSRLITVDSLKQPETLHPLHPGDQAKLHFSMAVDPADPNVVFLGGDRQESTFKTGIKHNETRVTDFVGRIFRVDVSAETPVIGHEQVIGHGARIPAGDPRLGNTQDILTAPHADSRFITFDGKGNLIEADDGGIFRLKNFRGNSDERRWESLNGSLNITELSDVAYDPLNDIILGGAQDVGTQEQITANSTTWQSVLAGDGNLVLTSVEPDKPDEPDDSGSLQTYRYAVGNNFKSTKRRLFDDQNQQQDAQALTLSGLSDTLANPFAKHQTDREFDGFLEIPGTINAVEPKRWILIMAFPENEEGEHQILTKYSCQ